jgi:hypothetical protein
MVVCYVCSGNYGGILWHIYCMCVGDNCICDLREYVSLLSMCHVVGMCV